MSTFVWPERVIIREVGLRDGLQSIAAGIGVGPLVALRMQLSA